MSALVCLFVVVVWVVFCSCGGFWLFFFVFFGGEGSCFLCGFCFVWVVLFFVSTKTCFDSTRDVLISQNIKRKHLESAGDVLITKYDYRVMV